MKKEKKQIINISEGIIISLVGVFLSILTLIWSKESFIKYASIFFLGIFSFLLLYILINFELKWKKNQKLKDV